MLTGKLADATGEWDLRLTRLESHRMFVRKHGAPRLRVTRTGLSVRTSPGYVNEKAKKNRPQAVLWILAAGYTLCPRIVLQSVCRMKKLSARVLPGGELRRRPPRDKNPC